MTPADAPEPDTQQYSDLDAALAADEQRRRDAMTGNALATWLTSCPPKFRDVTWDTTILQADPPFDPAAIEISNSWCLDPSANFIISGALGWGKTTLAIACVRRVLSEHPIAGARGMFAPVVSMFSDLRTDRDGAVMHHLKTVRYLILDDLGSGRTSLTDWEGERLYEIVNHRYLENLPLVITSNLDVRQGKEPHIQDEVGSQTWDRIRDGAVAVVVSGESRRKGRSA